MDFSTHLSQGTTSFSSSAMFGLHRSCSPSGTRVAGWHLNFSQSNSPRCTRSSFRYFSHWQSCVPQPYTSQDLVMLLLCPPLILTNVFVKQGPSIENKESSYFRSVEVREKLLLLHY